MAFGFSPSVHEWGQASWLAPTCDRQYDPEYGIAVGTLTAPLYYWQVTSAGANNARTTVDRESGYLKVYR